LQSALSNLFLEDLVIPLVLVGVTLGELGQATL
jgi:hypothetical protein